MQSVIIMQSEQFVLTSFGNGTAYSLDNTAEALSVFIQGDDATAFRNYLEALEKNTPNDEMMLVRLWEAHR